MTHELATITFHGTALLAVRGETPAETLVAMKPVVEGMGLDWKSQHAKITTHQVLAQTMVEITMVAEDWMHRHGAALVRDHNDRVIGQGVLRFPDRRRPPDANAPGPEASP